MKRGKTPLRCWDLTVLATRFSLLSALCLTGCAIGLPHHTSDTIYQVGNHTPDAGVIRGLYTPSGEFDGWLVRQWAVDDYNSRLSDVGAKLKPPVKPDAGITPYLGYHKMTGEAFDRWSEMVQGDLP